MVIFFLLNTLVYQNGDTLRFMDHDSIIDRWILHADTQLSDSLEERITRKAKVSSDNKFFFIYKERNALDYKPLQSEVVFYDARKRELWKEVRKDPVKIMFELSNIFDGYFIVVDADIYGNNPALYVIRDSTKTTVIERDEWMRINSYKVSSNGRFLVLHTRKRHIRQPWDYIYFVDLETKQNWEYLFPLCLSCKRRKISLDVDNAGQVEVVYKAEHRIFSKEGKLVDIFLKID